MDSSRATALKLVLAHEGGYVNNPADPGGPTNRGITQVVYDGYRVAKGLKPKSVRAITVAEVHAIYGTQYLDPIRYDRLPPGVGYAVADYAINSGCGRAVKDLQRTLNAMGAKLKIDSALGMATLKAIEEAAEAGEAEALIIALCERRLAFMRSLRTWKTFGKGWTRRVMGEFAGAQPESDSGVIDYALAMSQGEDTIPAPKRPVAGRATEASTAVSRTPGGAGSIAVVAGGIGAGLKEGADQILGIGLEGRMGQAAQIAAFALMFGGVLLMGYSIFSRFREKGAI